MMLLYLSAHDGRDSTEWGVSLLELDDRGIKFHDMLCDGAKGIMKGIEEPHLEVVVGRDLFHLLNALAPLLRLRCLFGSFCFCLYFLFGLVG
jgi:hypothetical protein